MNSVGSNAEGKLNCINAVVITQISCLICLPDRSGNFLVFGAEIAHNTVTSEKTGFGTVDSTAPRPVFAFSDQKFRAPFGANALSKVIGKS